MNRTFDLLWLRIREYFKHPAEDLRQANTIKPGRLYSNFGYICKAVRYTRDEQAKVDIDKRTTTAMPPDILIETVKGLGIRNKDAIDALQREADSLTPAPYSCQLCDFNRVGIPCPFYNQLADGSTVCDTHKYVILKNQR